MKALPILVLAFALSASACAQSTQQEAGEADRPSSRPGLYQCDGCEATEERSAADLDWRVTLPPEDEPGERLVLSGQVFMPDGTRAAPNVVLYFHQTNAEGYYRSINSTARGGRSDGMIEGWLATNEAGRYEVTTIKPAPYPDAGLPAHIHVYVKEPERRPYYIDDFVFEDDPYITSAYRNRQQLRGGSGILDLTPDGEGGWLGHRDLVLEW